MYEDTREEAMYSTRVVVDIIDCLNHKNRVVQNTAEKLCEIGKTRLYTHTLSLSLFSYCLYIKMYSSGVRS